MELIPKFLIFLMELKGKRHKVNTKKQKHYEKIHNSHSGNIRICLAFLDFM